jgi:hypothetical protein
MEIKEIVNVLTNFISYVDDFYNAKSGIYPIKGMTDKMVLNAVQKHIANPATDFAADTFDREKVRDIILADNNLLFGDF